MDSKFMLKFQDKLLSLKWDTNKEIEENIDWMLGLVSDDFGHDCQELLQAESTCLQVLGEKFWEHIKCKHS
jgi:hypothetical protein